MKYLELRQEIATPLFTFADAVKSFPADSVSDIKIQLARFVKKGYLRRLRRGLYDFSNSHFDEYSVTRYLRAYSYISFESALFLHNLMPDVPQAITSAVVGVSKIYRLNATAYIFIAVPKRLFYGFELQGSTKAGYYYLAKKEKAVLDYLYVRKIRSFADTRLDLLKLDLKIYNKYIKDYPDWMQKLKI